MARKDKRLFARFDLDYADHPKIGDLSDAAFRAHVEMVLYSRKYMTDGIIPMRVARRFASDALTELLTNDPDAPSLAQNSDGSYTLHGYADMNETREEIERRSRANAENGRRGGQAKAANSKRVATESLDETPSEQGSGNVAETETETETETELKTTRVSPADFEAAWAHWPKKAERKRSFDKFKRVAKSRGLEPLIADIVRFGDAYAKHTETRFVPALVVWLNGERWTDELPGSPAARQPVDGGRREELIDGIMWLNGKPRVGGPQGMTPEQFREWQDARERAS